MVQKPFNYLEIESIHRWNRLAAWWTAKVQQDGDPFRSRVLVPNILQLIPPISGKLVLDAGCGEGHLSRILVQNGADVIGIDYSKEMINHAIRVEEIQPLGIEYYVRSISNLEQFDKSQFDCVVSNMVVMDIPDIVSTFDEISRVLKPHGTFLLSLLNPDNVSSESPWLEALDGRPYVHQTQTSSSNNESIFEIRFHPEAPVRTLYFYRPTSHYISLLHDRNFEILNQLEPTVGVELLSEFPNPDTLSRYSPFLILKTIKFR